MYHIVLPDAPTGLHTTSSHRLQSEIQRLPGVQQGRVEQGQVTVLRFHEQWYLGAPEDNALGAAVA